MQITTDDSGQVLKLEGTLNIEVAEELHEALSDFLGGASSLVLDLSDADACDTAVPQLLYSARTTAKRTAKQLKWVGLTGPVAETAAALGLPVAALEGRAGGI